MLDAAVVGGGVMGKVGLLNKNIFLQSTDSTRTELHLWWFVDKK